MAGRFRPRRGTFAVVVVEFEVEEGAVNFEVVRVFGGVNEYGKVVVVGEDEDGWGEAAGEGEGNVYGGVKRVNLVAVGGLGDAGEVDPFTDSELGLDEEVFF